MAKKMYQMRVGAISLPNHEPSPSRKVENNINARFPFRQYERSFSCRSVTEERIPYRLFAEESVSSKAEITDRATTQSLCDQDAKLGPR